MDPRQVETCTAPKAQTNEYLGALTAWNAVNGGKPMAGCLKGKSNQYCEPGSPGYARKRITLKLAELQGRLHAPKLLNDWCG